jgi:hypothetical protein
MPITPKTGSLFHAETHKVLIGDLQAQKATLHPEQKP